MDQSTAASSNEGVTPPITEEAYHIAMKKKKSMSRRNRATRSGMLPVTSGQRLSRALLSNNQARLSVRVRPNILPITPTVLIRVRDSAVESGRNPLLEINEANLKLGERLNATRISSNDRWFTSLSVDKSIAQAV